MQTQKLEFEQAMNELKLQAAQAQANIQLHATHSQAAVKQSAAEDQASTKLQTMKNTAKVEKSTAETTADPVDKKILSMLEKINEQLSTKKPVYDKEGELIGVQVGSTFRPIKRDAKGNIEEF